MLVINFRDHSHWPVEKMRRVTTDNHTHYLVVCLGPVTIMANRS